MQIYSIQICIYRENVLKNQLYVLCHHSDNHYTENIGLKYILT